MQKIRILGDDTRYLALAVLLVVRQLFSVIFILASAGHFTPGTIASAAQQGVPMPGLLVPVSGLIALVGGLSVLFGYRAKFGAWLLVLFLVPVTLMMHNFWAVSDPMTFQLQLTLFIRNLVLLGGALLFAFFGAGRLSLDALMARPVVQLEYRDGEQLTEAASQLAMVKHLQAVGREQGLVSYDPHKLTPRPLQAGTRGGDLPRSVLR